MIEVSSDSEEEDEEDEDSEEYSGSEDESESEESEEKKPRAKKMLKKIPVNVKEAAKNKTRSIVPVKKTLVKITKGSLGNPSFPKTLRKPSCFSGRFCKFLAPKRGQFSG